VTDSWVPRARPGPATLVLLSLFGVSYLAQWIAEATLRFSLYDLFALTYALDVSLVWRWITFPLVEVPGNLLSRVLGMVFAYLMLSQHEARYGAASTMLVTLAGIVGAAIACLPFGFAGMGGPLAGMGPVIWAPLGVLLATAGDQPVMIFRWMLPNAKVAAGLLLLLPAASTLWSHDPTPLLEAIGGAGGGLLFAMAPGWRRDARAKKKKPPVRRHGFQVIQGGGERSDDDDRPKWLN
jgi:membrane associated rhomboid family serine protease